MNMMHISYIVYTNITAYYTQHVDLLTIAVRKRDLSSYFLKAIIYRHRHMEEARLLQRFI